MGFCGGSAVKYTPANAGDMGWIPGPGRSHMPQRNQDCTPQQEKPQKREDSTPLLESSSRSPQLEKKPSQQRRPSTAKNR